MKVEAGFFSLTEVTDPGQHHRYNEWHQLDHLPEQLTLPGIAWGQRWVSTPACRAARAVSTAPFDDVHYLTLYLLAPPLEQTLEDFQRLARDLSARGRFHRHRRTALTGAFEVVAALASPRVALSADALPYRPHRGIHVRLDEVADPQGPWFEGEHLAALVTLPSVAGAWTFRRGPVVGGAGEHRITVAWLDADPLAATAAIATLPEPRAGSVRRCFDGPLASIEPYRWDWFD